MINLVVNYRPATEADAIVMMRELFDFANKGLHSMTVTVTRDPAPCGHCGQTDHDTDHCPEQGG
jgi:hypothetical protein